MTTIRIVVHLIMGRKELKMFASFVFICKIIAIFVLMKHLAILAQLELINLEEFAINALTLALNAQVQQIVISVQ